MQRVSRSSVGEVVSMGTEDDCDAVLGAQLMVGIGVGWSVCTDGLDGSCNASAFRSISRKIPIGAGRALRAKLIG